MIDAITRHGHIERIEVNATLDPNFTVFLAVPDSYAESLSPGAMRKSEVAKMDLSGKSYILIVYLPSRAVETSPDDVLDALREVRKLVGAKRARENRKCKCHGLSQASCAVLLR